MGGLSRLCKLYGSMEVVGADGKKVIWVWDWVANKARLKSEMTKEEWKASEKAKWETLKPHLPDENNHFSQ